MSVTIADILGANDENFENEPQNESEKDDKYFISREELFNRIKDEAVKRYNDRINELNSDEDFEGGLVPIVASDKDGEAYLFIAQVSRGDVTGIIFFELNRISEIFGTLLGVFNEYIKSDGSAS